MSEPREGIRTCALRGATWSSCRRRASVPNTDAEPSKPFLWKIRVQAMQNQVAIVMCNRVGKEGDVTFAGQSVVVDPYGNVVSKADD